MYSYLFPFRFVGKSFPSFDCDFIDRLLMIRNSSGRWHGDIRYNIWWNKSDNEVKNICSGHDPQSVCFSLETKPAYFACRALNLGARIKVNKNMHVLLLMRNWKARVRRLLIANTDGIWTSFNCFAWRFIRYFSIERLQVHKSDLHTNRYSRCALWLKTHTAVKHIPTFYALNISTCLIALIL